MVDDSDIFYAGGKAFPDYAGKIFHAGGDQYHRMLFELTRAGGRHEDVRRINDALTTVMNAGYHPIPPVLDARFGTPEQRSFPQLPEGADPSRLDSALEILATLHFENLKLDRAKRN